jgi:hypothetical protein
LFVNPKTRVANVVCDSEPENVAERIAYLLEADPVRLATGDIEFRYPDAPNHNPVLGMRKATTPWLRSAQARFGLSTEIRVSMARAGETVKAVRSRHGTSFGPHESYVLIFGITGVERKDFAPFVTSFCEAIVGEPSGSGVAPAPIEITEPVREHAAGGEVVFFKQMHWLQITSKRFVLRGLLGNVKADVPIDQVVSFKGSGIDSIRVVLADGRTVKFNPGIQYRGRSLNALEQATGKRRQ